MTNKDLDADLTIARDAYIAEAQEKVDGPELAAARDAYFAAIAAYRT